MDNVYKNCPALMSDARFLTDYKSSTRRNEYIKYVNDIHRDDDLRVFLQKNGKNIADNVWNYHKKNNYCNVNGCVHARPSRNVPADLIKEKKDFDMLGAHNFQKMTPCTVGKDMRLN